MKVTKEQLTEISQIVVAEIANFLNRVPTKVDLKKSKVTHDSETNKFQFYYKRKFLGTLEFNEDRVDFEPSKTYKLKVGIPKEAEVA